MRDGYISYAEAEQTTSLNVSNQNEEWWDGKGAIKTLTGIEAFTNLDSLDCSKNQLDSTGFFKQYCLI